MSTHKIDSQWFTRASDMMAFFENKQPAERIQVDLDNDDFDQLQHDVLMAEAMASIEEFAPIDNEFLKESDVY